MKIAKPAHHFRKFERCFCFYQRPNRLFFTKKIDEYAYQGQKKAGLTVKPGGSHLKVFNLEGRMITTIPHSPHAKGTIKGICEVNVREAGFY
jgi:hypothetical protein